MAPKNENPLAQIQPTQNCDMSLVGGGDYLRRIKLCADLTGEVKEKLAEVGDYFLSGVENLGAEVEVVVVKARPHALQLVDASSKVGAESFDMADPVFQKIRQEKDEYPTQQDPNNMYGYDYLLWLPEQQTFVTIFLCKQALYKSVPQFQKGLGRGLCVMGNREHPSKKNPKITYRVPTLVVAESQAYTPPTLPELEHAIELFDNPRVQSQTPEPTKAKAKAKPKAGGRKGR
jgi:hypothetical protein